MRRLRAVRRRLLYGDRLGSWNWRSLIVSAALLGTVVVSALGAWAVRASWLDHQRSVERALDEYASYAALTFAREMATQNAHLRVQALAPVMGAAAYEGGALPLAGLAATARPVLDREMDFGNDPQRGVFRLDLATGRYEGLEHAGDSIAARAIRGLVLARRAALDTAQIPLQSIVPIGGDDPVTVTYALHRPANGRPTAVYGVIVSWDRSGKILARRVLQRSVLLPPSLVEPARGPGETPGLDTLIALRVTWPDGRELFQTPARFTSAAEGSYRMPGTSATMHATLHPALADRLRASMLNDDRRRLQVALPILSLVLAALTILHLWRERELVRARRDFVASVSHELRTPLAQIRMFSETLLLGREESHEERLRWTAVIGREARRLGDLVENILLFSHIDASRARFEPERTDLGELVEDAVEAYVPLAASRRMRIVADAPSRIYAVVDPHAMRQVVVNLIDNALKYGPAGQTVTVEVERDGAWARLSVCDQGPGVAAADRARLWRPFVRLGQGGSNTGGSGIGLSVVRSLVTQHGGQVAVGDAPTGGARFVITLPLVSGATVTQLPPREPREPRGDGVIVG